MVEERHSKEYEVAGFKVTIHIMDTSSSYSFQAMRKLSIQNADAFTLVFSVDDSESLEAIKSLREEIKFTPIVVVGNKKDKPHERRVSANDVLATVNLDWNNGFLEVSAKENKNVKVFRELLQQANLPSQRSLALRHRREPFPKDKSVRPPMNKINSYTLS